MKIGIDARFFGAKDRGIGRYTENLIRNLEKIDQPAGGNQYFIFLKKQRWDDYNPGSKNFQKVKFSLNFKKYKLDLMHFTHYKVFPYNGKFILTVHDLIWQKFPILGFAKRLIYKIFFNLAIKRSEKIIAVSNYVKEDILRNYRINPEKIVVIYEGVS
jgi:glycosyltransferase involved in cell wall biosynthesis